MDDESQPIRTKISAYYDIFGFCWKYNYQTSEKYKFFVVDFLSDQIYLDDSFVSFGLVLRS